MSRRPARGAAVGSRPGLVVLAGALAAACALGGALPAGAEEVVPDAPGLTYRVLEPAYRVLEVKYAEGTASGGVMQRGELIRLSSSVLFEKDKATLTSRAKAELAELKRRVGAAKVGSVKVDGYTDNVRGAVDNNKLSQDRADAIARLLKRDFPKLKITAKGHGSSNPVASNDSEAGKALNRRVDITLGG